MSKFKHHMKINKVATWNEAYMNYNVLERLLKPLIILDNNMIK
jgi:SPX domain protein involved in polyphosphate accumulation